MDSVLLIVALGAVAAGFVQGLSGFGFGMVAMSFWAWTLEPRLAALLAVCGALTGQLVAAATVRRGFDRVRLLPFVLGGLVGIPIGVAVLPRLDMDAFKVILGTLLVLWCTLRGLDKDVQRAIIQNFNLAMLLVTFITYLATGLVTREALPLLAIVVPAMLVPVLLGARLYHGISDARFRQIVLGMLTLSGVAMLVASLPKVLARLG